MMKSFLLVSLLASLFNLTCILQCNAQQKKVILAVFAHPDDEQTISPVLAKYAAAGISIYLAVVTDGRYGTAEHFGVDDPDSLAAIRAGELNCVTRMLGINPPIMMGLHDQLHMKEGMDSLGKQLSIMRLKIAALFEELKPDIVITWGTSGLTGHPDHRLVSDIVTEVFSMKKWLQPANLYYTELATGNVPSNRFGLSTVDASYLNTRITVSKSETEKARLSWNCHKSQYTTEFMNELEKLFWTSQKGTSYFRSYRSPETVQYSFFPATLSAGLK